MTNGSIVPSKFRSGREFRQFDFNGLPIRAITDDGGNIWFVGADGCKALGYSNPSQVIADNVRPEDKTYATLQKGLVIAISDEYIPGSGTQILLISETALYTLGLSSEKAEAKPFQLWIINEVLPAIRKSASYIASPKTLAEQALIQAQALVELERRVDDHDEHLVRQDNRIDRIEARQLAGEFGEGYFSIVAYCKLMKLPPPDEDTAKMLGQRATQLSTDKGYMIGRTKHPRFAYVNTYHTDILDEIFGIDPKELR